MPGPLAVNDTVTVNEDSSVTFDVRTNDSGHQVSTCSPSTAPASRRLAPPLPWPTARWRSALDGRLSYTPTANFFGLENFNYSVVDDLGRFRDTQTASVDRQQRQ